MATVAPFPGAQSEHRDLPYWMERVVKELDNLRHNPDRDAVHDLRVAIRRCRSVASVMQEVDPHPAWKELRRLPRKLFRKLGALRDAQIMQQWIVDNSAQNDKLRLVLAESFEAREPQLLRDCLRVAAKFDEKSWNRLQAKVRRRQRLVLQGGLAAQCLALERYEEARELHGKALHSRSARSWHSLRIGLKKLRYTVENFLPEQHKAWSSDFKTLQDLLGEVHDLDVLSGIVKKTGGQELLTVRQEWQRTIDRQRATCLGQYHELAVGGDSVWRKWRSALPDGRKVQSAAHARILATAHATDAHPRRATEVSRISVAVFDALRRVHAGPALSNRRLRRILRAASRLCGLNFKDSTTAPQKAARRFLLHLPAPPSWTANNWQVLAWTVRYHRGAEPKNKSNGLSRMDEQEQAAVKTLAGILRLAREIRKCSPAPCAKLRAEKTLDAVTLFVPELVDSAETAARLAAAKHLLDACLVSPLLLRAEIYQQIKAPVSEEPKQLLRFAAASD